MFKFTLPDSPAEIEAASNIIDYKDIMIDLRFKEAFVGLTDQEQKMLNKLNEWFNNDLEFKIIL